MDRYDQWLAGTLARLWEEHKEHIPWEDAGPGDSTEEDDMTAGTETSPGYQDDHCDHDDPAVTNGMCECGTQVGPITITMALDGLPAACPECGAPPPDGAWTLGVYGGILNVACARCFTMVAPVRAVAA